MNEIFIFIIGIFFGSFANVCIHRIPYGLSIINPPSHCPKCLVPIKWKDNIPVLSFILLRFKCRICRIPISLEYPVVEFLTGVLFLLSYILFGFSSLFFISLILCMYLIIISFIDLHLKIIPDSLSISLFFIGIAVSFFNPIVEYSIFKSIYGALAGFSILLIVAFFGKKIYKKDAMGGGDIKLILACGSFLGIKNTLFALMLSCFMGGVAGIIMILLKRKKTSDFIPFGPFIAAASLYTFLTRKI